MSQHSPADILRHALVIAGAGTLRSVAPAGAWPVFVGNLPDQPDSAICLYDTGGLRDGRLMGGASGGGRSITHPGWQIRVRSASPLDAWAKAREIVEILDGIKAFECPIGSAGYTIASVTQTSDLLSFQWAAEQKVTRREQITFNGTITIGTSATAPPILEGIRVAIGGLIVVYGS